MPHNPTAMRAAAAFAVANCKGRFKDLQGRDINTDQRFGYQCMDLWNWFRTYVLGFADVLPTPDAASVWELNNQPKLRLWQFFDGVTPDRPAMAGDVGIMNRAFFGNGVGHIFIVLRDLGQQLEVLELNGLGDGFEDDAGGQHGSPARVHTWPKTNLYGYLRWIGPTPDTGTIAPAGDTQKEIFTMSQFEEVQKQQGLTHKKLNNITAGLRGFAAAVKGYAVQNQKWHGQTHAKVNAIREVMDQFAAGQGTQIDWDKVEAAAKSGASEAFAEAIGGLDPAALEALEGTDA